MLTAKPRADQRHAWAIWITARDMETNAPYPVGYWTGDDAATILIDGQSRAYYGAGAALEISPITYQLGAVVQTQSVSLGPLAPEVRQVLRGYDTRQAPVEIHLITLDDLDRPSASDLAFRGVIDSFEIVDGPIDDFGNSTVVCQAEMVSVARMLTRTLTLKQSDASQKLRNANDAFRQYADVAGEVRVTWMGETDNPHKAREKNNLKR